jgi:type IV pilus assembly protein PilY1
MQRMNINKAIRSDLARMAVTALVTWGLTLPAFATTPLGDKPVAADLKVAGNVALALSVEWPTVARAAYATGAYSSANEYYGYFDRNKCYAYRYVATEVSTTGGSMPTAASQVRHFAPAGLASNRTCGDDVTWSGNFLNWAAGQAIDPFRWAMTGGNRVVDTPTETVIQKAWHSGQGSLFPDKSLPPAEIAGATPFTGTAFNTRIQGAGFGMRFTVGGGAGSFTGKYYNRSGSNYNSLPSATETPTLERQDATIDFGWGTGSPGGAVNANNFVVVWEGTFPITVGGDYRFRAGSDDGVRVYVNDMTTPVIDRWADRGLSFDNSSDINLAAGSTVRVRVEYYERSGDASMFLQWRTPGSSDYVVFNGGGAGPGNLANTPVDYNPANAIVAGTVYDLKVRAKVCDPASSAGGVESNCVQYSNGWKPEGLMQQYAKRMRFSTFGYLNHESNNRDGGVMRASQKFVGPLEPVPGSPDIANPQGEWDATTGVMLSNPDSNDLNATITNYGLAAGDVLYSGAMNYLNKFGQIYTGNYKGLDPVSEMYYTSLRYLRGLDNVPEYSNAAAGAGDNPNTPEVRRRLDGFPVITDWRPNATNRSYRKEPIQYYCQKNFVLGIGDIYTHRDKNLPGNATGQSGRFGTEEPTLPAAVATDTAVDALRAANKLGELEGLGASVGTTNDYNGRFNSAGIAGLAFWANTNDIRPATAGVPAQITDGKQTVQTYWVDVLEGANDATVAKNQFRLAAKYGGFKVPDGFSMYGRATALEQDWWANTGDYVGGSTSVLRPRNYFTAGNPKQMIDGLTSAFAQISNEIDSFTTSFSTSLPQLVTSGNMSFSSQFDSRDWTSELIAKELSFDLGNNEVRPPTERWKASAVLNTLVANSGWDDKRKVITYTGTAGVPFRLSSLTSAQRAALDSPLRAVNDAGDVLNYIRGERRYEVNSTSSADAADKVYRSRRTQGEDRLLGDIAGSKLVPVAPPNFPFSDATNPGYSQFVADYRARRTVVYAGANDGMLHAFDGSTTTAEGGGKELFAYVPSGVYSGPSGTPAVNGLAALVNPNREHYYYVNATPQNVDVDLYNTYYGSSETKPTGTNWRTLLIGGMGKGGRSYYALDVTDTDGMVSASESTLAQRVLWEFTDPDMGYTFGEPIVTKTKKYGWTVIFTSGYNNADGKGYFFLVNPRNGVLLEKISTDTGTPSQQAGLATAKAAIPDYTDNTADAVYAGDLLGNLWRLDVSGTDRNVLSTLNPTGSATDTTPVPFAVLTDATGERQPITTRVIIEAQRGSTERMIAVGTGRYLDESDTNNAQQQTYYAIRDGYASGFSTTANSGVTFPIGRENLVENTDPTQGLNVPANRLGWYVDLGTVDFGSITRGRRVINDSDAFEGLVAFAAMVPVSTNPCAPSGDSRIYVLDLRTGKSSLTAASSSGGSGGGSTTALTIPFLERQGIVTDLRFVSVDGKARLLSGNDRGDVTLTDPNRAASSGLRRLNWRELPLNN